MDYFNDYFPRNLSLEEHYRKILRTLGITGNPKKKLLNLLEILKSKHPSTLPHYEHSLRVAMLAYWIACFMHLDGKPAFYAGSLHDIGKLLTPVDVLGKTGEWTEVDAKIMESHIIDGYALLQGSFDYTSEIIKWHHQFQKNVYPKNIGQPKRDFRKGPMSIIPLFGRILALADSYDAMHRIYNRTVMTGTLIQECMLEQNPDQKILVDALYQMRIFTTYTEKDGGIPWKIPNPKKWNI